MGGKFLMNWDEGKRVSEVSEVQKVFRIEVYMCYSNSFICDDHKRRGDF